MKIAPREIESYVAAPKHRAVLFFGPDAGLVRERAKRVSKAVLPANFDPFALVDIPEARLLADPALLADEFSAISMMAPRRVIMLQGGDKLTKIIEGALPYLNDSVWLVVSADELPTRSSLRALFEKEPALAAIPCYRDEVRDVQAVIRKVFDAAGIEAGRDVMDYLSNQLGNDRYVTYQELEKLVTYAGEDKTLTLADVQALVDYNRETGFDDLVNAVADRNLAALDNTLTLLLREGTSPVAYLRALQRYFNRLYFIKSEMAAGRSAEQVIDNLKPKVFFRQVPILTRHIQSWSLDAIVKALKLLVAAELACKTSDIPMIPASSRRLLQVTQAR